MKRKSNFSIMLSLIKLLKPLALPMCVAILMGVLGFITAFGLAVFGVYALFSALPQFSDGMANLFLGGFETKTYLILLVVSGFLRGILHYIEQYFNHLIAFKILAIIRNKVFTAMRRLAPTKLDRKNPGQLVSLIMGDIELLEIFYAHTISPIMIAFVVTILLFLFHFSIHPLMAVVPLVSQIVIGIICPLIASKKGSATSAEIRDSIGELNGQFIDKLRGIREVLQYDYSEKTLKELDDVTEKLLEKQAIIKNQGANLTTVIDSMIIIFSVMQVFVSLYLLKTGVPTFIIPACVISIVLTSGSFGPYISLANLGNSLTHTFACGDRILSILEEKPVIEPVTNGVNLDYNKPLDAVLANVAFAYDSNQPQVLKNVDLKINQGKIVGLMGESGSGKSTLLKLLLRFWDPTKGSISIGENNIKEINTQEIYKHINYMTQSTHLFTGSIRDNLLIAKPDATEDELHDALKKASIYDFVMSLPNGLDSRVGENGVNFSGGEQQRFGLSRCFLADKEMLLLDEPTSNIDSINEALILRAIVNERKSKTIVFVSHRPSTLAVCDEIIKINKGEIDA